MNDKSNKSALSGVAAQGDDLSITESEKRVTNSVVDNERSTKPQGDGEARVSDEMVVRAHSARGLFLWKHGDHNHNKLPAMRAALEAALGVADQDGKE